MKIWVSERGKRKRKSNPVRWEHTSISTGSQVEGSGEVPHLYCTIGVSSEDVPARAWPHPTAAFTFMNTEPTDGCGVHCLDHTHPAIQLVCIPVFSKTLFMVPRVLFNLFLIAHTVATYKWFYTSLSSGIHYCNLYRTSHITITTSGFNQLS